MDIYILRSGKEVGPLSEVTVQTLLKQGSVLLNDPAWRPGMAQWSPLHSVLYPAASPAEMYRPPAPGVLTPPSAPSAQPVPTGPVPQTRITGPANAFPDAATAVSIVPASAKQKAFLSFMGIDCPPDLTKEQAAALTQEATDKPTDPQRLALWNAERLRLHPDIFSEEIQANKDNRASVFLQVIQTEGAEFFSKVTKAHCQVLIGALDARFPNWDAGDPEKAAWKYIFPALEQKFPQLVAASAKGKFNFPGQPVAVPRPGGQGRMAPPKVKAKRSNPLGAMVRGLIWGGVILSGLYFGKDYLQPWTGRLQEWVAKASASKPAPVAAAQPANEPVSKDGAGKKKALKPKNADVPAPVAKGGPVPKPDAEKAGTPQAKTEEAVPAETPGAAPKAVLLLTKASEVQLPFGKLVLQPGTQLKFMASEGDNVRVLYGKDVLVLPASSTDYVAPTGAPAAPAKPAVSTNSLF
jgi:hypothetical protein